ncbi:MAG TPA: glycosyltransferase family 2 protein [Bryocella sp.]|nr:glycosyltransferase family 2 protein [Bryocella sp.]
MLRESNSSAVLTDTEPTYYRFTSTPKMPLLSVAIITLNEEANLARTLESVSWADEIIVVDSGSTDRTAEIARDRGARVIDHLWTGFAAQKNFALSQCTGDWVLSLDADEELSTDLQFQMQSLLMSKPAVDAYFIKRRNLFLGRWIKYGGFYPDPKLRLFRRSAANFVQTPQFEERPVHETIVFNGISATLDYDLIHHAYPTLSTYIEHMDRYSSLGADLLISKRRTSRSSLSFAFNVWLIPQLTFIWNYIFRLGFLDGREGLLLHLYHAIYTSWKYAKAWESSRKS